MSTIMTDTIWKFVKMLYKDQDEVTQIKYAADILGHVKGSVYFPLTNKEGRTAHIILTDTKWIMFGYDKVTGQPAFFEGTIKEE